MFAEDDELKDDELNDHGTMRLINATQNVIKMLREETGNKTGAATVAGRSGADAIRRTL